MFTFPDAVDRNKHQIMPLAYLLAVATLIFVLFSGWGYDDPYITYRYAHNLIKGEGFVYNSGEQILSTTTPLFTLLLAIIGSLWQDIPRVANLIGALSIAAGALFLWDLAHTWETPLVGWTALLLYPTFPLLLATIGSETPLYIALILGCFAAYARRGYNWAAAFAALTVLARPDGLLVPILLGMHYLLIERRPIPWRAVIIFVSLVLPWLVFSSFYFGSPIPATLATKQHQGSMAISQRFVRGFLTILKPYSQGWNYWVEACLGLVGLGWVALQARRWLLFLAWGGAYIISYALLGVSRYFWYYAPFVPVIVVLAGLGVSTLISLIGRIHPRYSGRIPTLVLFMLLVVPLVPGQVQWAGQIPVQTSRQDIYRAVGYWLDANLPRDASVGTLEVGTIGYYAHRRMVDFAGLIQPEVAMHLNEGTTYDDAALYAAVKFRPDYLVLQEGYFPKLDQDFVSPNCQAVATYAGDQYGYPANLNVYRCR
ncbi:MAG: hypothetical protein A2W33_06230 [Chloroflexi bacterium RBG_16_52_11]|nr:MAG: hypothetical protein A2W33_06230 [Chloroflexi bacterium RBG_16_52_11]